MSLSERKLTQEEIDEFHLRADQTLGNLRLSPSSDSAEKIVSTIDAFVDNWQKERRRLFARKALTRSGPKPIDVALGLAAVWGDQLVSEFEWEWTCIISEGTEYYSIVQSDREYVIYAPYFLRGCLEDPKVDCTVLMPFNMIKAGKIPQIPAKSYVNLMQGVQRILPKG